MGRSEVSTARPALPNVFLSLQKMIFPFSAPFAPLSKQEGARTPSHNTSRGKGKGVIPVLDYPEVSPNFS